MPLTLAKHVMCCAAVRRFDSKKGAVDCILQNTSLRSALQGAIHGARKTALRAFFTGEYGRLRKFTKPMRKAELFPTDKRYQSGWTERDNPARPTCVGVSLVNLVTWFGYR